MACSSAPDVIGEALGTWEGQRPPLFPLLRGRSSQVTRGIRRPCSSSTKYLPWWDISVALLRWNEEGGSLAGVVGIDLGGISGKFGVAAGAAGEFGPAAVSDAVDVLTIDGGRLGRACSPAAVGGGTEAGS